MQPSGILPGVTVWELPPLILHPFNERISPAELLENSKAALMLSGLLPKEGYDDEDLTRRLLLGRYSEIRMLFFLGKDILRWMNQCVESVARIPELAGTGIEAQSFGAMVACNPPEVVKTKLTGWGVTDYSSLFSRAIGLHSVFTHPPEPGMLTPEFLKAYHRYADHLWACYLRLQPYQPIGPDRFQFQLYASGEYSRMLESTWGGE
jgi:hypothetical protein